MPTSGWKELYKANAYLKTPDGAGEELVEYQVQVCAKRVHTMLVRAARSKGGLAVSGPIKVRVTGRIVTKPKPSV